MTASTLVRGCHVRLLRVRRLPGLVLGAFVAAHAALVLFFRTDLFINGVSLPLAAATQGLVTHALLTNLIAAAVLFGGVAASGHRLALRDLLLRGGWGGRNDLVRALAFGILIWTGMHVVASVFGAAYGSPPGLMLPEGPATGFIGEVVGIALGTSLVEELIYRGFLLGQAVAVAGYWGLHGDRQLIAGLAASQLLFGLGHVPLGLHLGWEGAMLGLYVMQVTLVGVFFAVVVLRTGNLWMGIVVHALVNAPVLLVATPVHHRLIALTVSFAFLIVVPALIDRYFPDLSAARRARRGLPPVLGDRPKPKNL